jgi:hypothetical protein
MSDLFTTVVSRNEEGEFSSSLCWQWRLESGENENSSLKLLYCNDTSARINSTGTVMYKLIGMFGLRISP